jgi:soluble lytic murein transglycosylase
LSAVLAFASLGFFSGDLHNNCNSTGVPSYYCSLESFEAQVFEKRIQQHLDLRNAELQTIRGRIHRVISRYHTGLDETLAGQIPDWIISESEKYGLDPLFLTAIIVTESSFYNWSKSNRGALGLMQIRPPTGLILASETRREWKGSPMLYDPGVNIALGTYYFDKLLKRYGDLKLALEAYNHGPTKLNRYLRKGLRPASYSLKVLQNYERVLSIPTGKFPYDGSI